MHSIICGHMIDLTNAVGVVRNDTSAISIVMRGGDVVNIDVGALDAEQAYREAINAVARVAEKRSLPISSVIASNSR